MIEAEQRLIHGKKFSGHGCYNRDEDEDGDGECDNILPSATVAAGEDCLWPWDIHIPSPITTLII